MLFNSLHFLIFFPIVALFYFIIPYKLRWIWLLFASYFFYMSWNALYGILLFAVSIITWIMGLLIGRTDLKPNLRKICLAAGIILTLSPLIYYKYAKFVLSNLNTIFTRIGIEIENPAFDIILPLGISFYTFQALGYIIDVYREEVPSEKNLARHALFISFFPQLLAGPIGRAKSLRPELFAHHDFNYDGTRYGMLLMLWGYFQKMVIADHAAILVSSVYDNFYYAIGYQIVNATFLFSIQIYCDFAAYSLIALGAAKVMGIHLIDNFRQPYFAVSIQDFWRRWHISLSTWFRDYLYIPLGGSRGSQFKKYRNIMITFLVSGLWHGASWNFVAWGGLHGFYQIAGDLLRRKKVRNGEQKQYIFIKAIVTFLLVSFAWIFFRANGISAALSMIRRIFANFLTGKVNEEWIINPTLIFGIVVLLLVDIYRMKHDIFANILKQKAFIRWVVYYSVTLIIVLFGMYGTEYVQSQFIYFNF